jgi:hypothetical protein
MVFRTLCLLVLLTWLIAGPYLCRANPIDLSGYTKAEVDLLARNHGFPEADYPFFSKPNGCGPDGWKGRLTPEQSHLLYGPNFRDACNDHDRAYMTLGQNRKQADRRFRSSLYKTIVSHQIETLLRAASEEDPPKPPSLLPRKSDLHQRLKGQAYKGLFDLLRSENWTQFSEKQLTAYQGILRDEVLYQTEKLLAELQLSSASLMLKPQRTVEMLIVAELYYQAVRRYGNKYYEQSQKRQREYEDWLRTYLKDNPKINPENPADPPTESASNSLVSEERLREVGD